ncbi:hypothetical protein BC940DRAFT_332918 [Gongronella butleri]|nr:hypothetical protein BC940DRAFT_332918 [Gongronella butleri]
MTNLQPLEHQSAASTDSAPQPNDLSLGSSPSSSASSAVSQQQDRLFALSLRDPASDDGSVSVSTLVQDADVEMSEAPAMLGAASTLNSSIAAVTEAPHHEGAASSVPAPSVVVAPSASVPSPLEAINAIAAHVAQAQRELHSCSMAFAFAKATHASQQEVDRLCARMTEAAAYSDSLCKVQASLQASLPAAPASAPLVGQDKRKRALPDDLPLLRFDYHKDMSDDNASKDAKQDRKGKAITKFYEDVEEFLDDLKPVMARAGIALDDSWQQIIDAVTILCWTVLLLRRWGPTDQRLGRKHGTQSGAATGHVDGPFNNETFATWLLLCVA